MNSIYARIDNNHREWFTLKVNDMAVENQMDYKLYNLIDVLLPEPIRNVLGVEFPNLGLINEW